MTSNLADGTAPAPASSSASDAWRFDYRLTGWARESHNDAIYCVAFCGKGGAPGRGGEEEEEEEEEGAEEADEGGGEQQLALDRVFASAGGRRITVYYAPSLPPPSSPSSPSSEDEDAAEAEREGEARGETAEKKRKRQLQLPELERQQLPFSVLQTYVDAAADEEFYVCKWARRVVLVRDCDCGGGGSRKKKSRSWDKDGDGEEGGSESKERGHRRRLHRTTLPLLLAAGRRGTLRVIDPSLGGLSWTARGHGGPINDIAVHPTRPALALTASRDQSVRLWNLATRRCVARLAGGDGAHVAEVLSVDWHPLDALTFVSCGFDSGVKIWSLEGVAGAVEESFFEGGGGGGSGRGRRRGRETDLDGGNDGAGDGDGDETDEAAAPFAPFAPRLVPSPRFSSQRVHSAVADCVRWLGPGVLLSKTADDRVLAWGVEGLEGLPCPLVAGPRSLPAPAPAPAPAAAAAAAAAAPRLERPRVRLLNSLRLSGAEDVYFVRFGLDAAGRTLACGGREGRVCVFDPRRVPLPAGGPAEPRRKLRCAVPRGVRSGLKDRKQQQQQGGGGKGGGGKGGKGGGGGKGAPSSSSAAAAGGCGGESVVRQTALSDDGSTLLASCDDGTIWRFDRPRRKGGGGEA